ncbi:Uma2 family endonuclease [Streptomyces sp. NPDC059092]|uniref:Uma2 family endonuclease n=1 Tax=Streptomyces sp. NPDC059092 TaxID=3346725 RepID=UPI0036A5489D
MSTHSADEGPEPAWADLVRIWEQADAPEGYKVEIVEGVVTVSPPPFWDHGLTASSVHRSLGTVIPEEWYVFQRYHAAAPSCRGVFMPDLMVVAGEKDKPAPGELFPAGQAKLVVEITSPDSATRDRVTKAHAYAQAGVPLYLLLDPWASDRPTATLYGEPESGTYRTLQAVEYGGKLTLPAPFDLAIDTSELPVS